MLKYIFWIWWSSNFDVLGEETFQNFAVAPYGENGHENEYGGKSKLW